MKNTGASEFKSKKIHSIGVERYFDKSIIITNGNDFIICCRIFKKNADIDPIRIK